MAAKTRISSLVAVLLAVTLLASGCGESSDPENWALAGEAGDVQANFFRACTEANEDGGAFSLTASQARVYCTCSFEKLVTYYGGIITSEGGLTDAATPGAGGSFDDFRKLDSDLRNDPTDIPSSVEAFLTSCAELAQGSASS